MTAYEAAVREKDQLYARIQLVREEIKQEQDPADAESRSTVFASCSRCTTRALSGWNIFAHRRKKRHKAVKRTVIYTSAAGADVNSFDFFERCDLTFCRPRRKSSPLG